MHSANQVFTTKGMSPQEGFDGWRQLFCESTMPFKLERMGSGEFSAHAYLRPIGKLSLFTTICHQEFVCQGNRGRSEVSRSKEDSVVLFVRGANQGNLKYGNHASTTLRPDEWFISNPQDSYAGVSNPGMNVTHALTIPMDVCRNLHASGKTYGRLMAPNNLPNKLVANYIQTLASGGAITDVATGEMVSRNLLELIALALNDTHEMREICDNGLSSGLLLSITQYLDAHFLDQELSYKQVAAHLEITPRYLQMLFERNGTTFTDQLYLRRLSHAHRLLTDSLHRNHSITDIAYASGFQSLTHFGRRFREMYGMTPREHRSFS